MYDKINAKKFLFGKIKGKLIDFGFFNKVKTELNGQEIIIDDISSNNPLKEIAI